MPPSVLSAFLVFTFITAFTPGPNTILALSVGARRGFRGSTPLLLGIGCGFLGVMLLCGALTFSLSSLSPSFLKIMRIAGFLYILWLAWKIAASASKDADANADAGFLAGFLLQFLNVKVLLYGLTAYAGFILPCDTSLSALLAGAFFLTLAGSAGTAVWALAGSFLQRFFRRHARMANYVMAALLICCAASLLL